MPNQALLNSSPGEVIQHSISRLTILMDRFGNLEDYLLAEDFNYDVIDVILHLQFLKFTVNPTVNN